MRTAAIVGCGKFVEGKEGWAIGHNHGNGYRKVDPALQLHGVDPNPENLAAFGKTFQLPPEQMHSSLDSLLNQLIPDFLSVCTWPGLHAPMVCQAAKAGVKGILCEKPMALNMGEIREMEEACTASGTRLGIAHQRRYAPAFQRAKQLLKEGFLGSEIVIEARVGDGWDMLSWTTHWFDLANYLYGDRPSSVLAGLHSSGQRRYGHAVEDASVVFLEYTGKRQAIFVTGPEVPGEAWVSIRGSNGMMAIHGETRVEIFHKTGYRNEPFEKPVDGFAELIREMIGAVELDRPFLCDAGETAGATEIAYAAHESARRRQMITLPLSTMFAPLEILQNAPQIPQPNGQVVFFADDHFGSGGRAGLREALQSLYCKSGLREIEAESGLKNGVLDSAGLLVIYHTQPEVDAETQTVLRNWIQKGGTTMIVHAGLGAYPQWEEYLHWCGRCWDWQNSRHPHKPSRLECTGAIPFPWKSISLPKDEVFMDLRDKSDCKDLLMAQTDIELCPAAWINKEKTNIGVWVPGHRADFWTIDAVLAGFQTLVEEVLER